MNKGVVIILNDGIGGMVERMHQLGTQLDSIDEIFVLNPARGGFFTNLVNIDKRANPITFNDRFSHKDIGACRLHVGNVTSKVALLSKFRHVINTHDQATRFLCAGNSTAFYFLLVRWIFQYKIPIIFLSRNSLSEKHTFSRLVYQAAYWLLLRPSDRIVSISEGLQRELRTRSNKVRRHVIYNGVSLPAPTLYQYKSLELKGHNFLVVARLDPQKRIDLCIDAISVLRKKGHEINLTIYGDGSERRFLEQRSLDHNLEKYIHFMGWVNNKDIPYEEHSVFLLSSDFEGFGISIVEAMSHGLPAIVTDCSHGPSEIVENKISGYVVKQGSASLLAHAIERWLLLSPGTKRTMSEAAVERARFFCQEKMIDSYRKLLDDYAN